MKTRTAMLALHLLLFRFSGQVGIPNPKPLENTYKCLSIVNVNFNLVSSIHTNSSQDSLGKKLGEIRFYGKRKLGP